MTPENARASNADEIERLHHEANNRLHVLLANAQMLESLQESEPGRANAAAVVDAARGLRRVLGRLFATLEGDDPSADAQTPR
jgi:hypothetical protein